MKDIIREAALGQVLRFVTSNKVGYYLEELEGFQIPWEVAAAVEKEKAINDQTTPVPSLQNPGADVEKAEITQSRTNESSLYRHPTEQDPRALPDVHAIRTRSRESTTPWSEERLEVEQQHSAERIQSAIIQPQVTSDGVVLVDWYTTDDPENPQNWSVAKKSYVSFLIFIYTFVVYCASAIYTSSEPQIMERFGIGQAKASLGLSLYVIGYGVGPLLFSPLSEVPFFGRNIPYIVSFASFVILSVPLALVDNYAGLLVLRFLTGFMGSPCLASGGATMQDMFSLLKLPYALSFWTAGAFCAPALGPLLSGFAVTAENWRWSLWEVLWMSGPIWILFFISMPETSAANILLRRAKRLRKLTGNDKYRSRSEIDQGTKKFSTIVYEALLIPFIICIQDPAVLYVNIYSSIIYGTYYSFFEAFPLVYVEEYGFNLGELGLVFLTIIIGCILGLATYFAYQRYYLEPDIKKNGLRSQEHRLVPGLFAVWLLPIGLFWFGWTATPSIHWIVSVIPNILYAYGAFILFQCIFMYLPLTYPQYAASLFAANDTSRSALAAGSIIFAHPMYVNLGIGRGVSILGGLMVGGAVGIVVLYYYGATLRAKSKFALS
ncbi:putative major facilitator superfamily transporter [Phaeomoniella chlamydospora]|uniref:Putative major facilitator superfamily transporter n=1 Tax=Phaeomoniella chlamydospora TaxID=158046 RepID=A0A0G2GNQ6_PHACM|nr:putative major facilitator superfamily transporter [Phaeomoniella chlamydospora]